MQTTKENIGLWLIGASALLIFIALILVGPMAQDLTYHSFSDTTPILGIPNALNVLSNLPFLLVGMWGLVLLIKGGQLRILAENKAAYFALFFGVALVAFGSGYYHLWPDNKTLVWDRLPMTIAFMGLVSIVVSEFISVRLGRMLLFPLLAFGIFSVLYWHYTELDGHGDLRPYIYVQFFPIVAIPVVLLSFRSVYNRISCYWWLMAAYVLAKLVEYFDYSIYHHLELLSGHSIKHLIAAIGLYILLSGFRRREKISIHGFNSGRPNPSLSDYSTGSS